MAVQESYERVTTLLDHDSDDRDFTEMIAREERANAANDREVAFGMFGLFAVPAIALIVVGVLGIVRRGDDSYRVLDDSNTERVGEVLEKCTAPDHWFTVMFFQWCQSVLWVARHCWAFLRGTKNGPESSRDRETDGQAW
jgi:hypothetical protein